MQRIGSSTSSITHGTFPLMGFVPAGILIATETGPIWIPILICVGSIYWLWKRTRNVFSVYLDGRTLVVKNSSGIERIDRDQIKYIGIGLNEVSIQFSQKTKFGHEIYFYTPVKKGFMELPIRDKKIEQLLIDFKNMNF